MKIEECNIKDYDSLVISKTKCSEYFSSDVAYDIFIKVLQYSPRACIPYSLKRETGLRMMWNRFNIDSKCTREFGREECLANWFDGLQESFLITGGISRSFSSKRRSKEKRPSERYIHINFRSLYIRDERILWTGREEPAEKQCLFWNSISLNKHT